MVCNWDWFKVFYHVAEEKQISKAAIKLNITQPAVSQSIKMLEEYVGFSLFIRNSKGVTLTSSGKELFNNISLAFIQISTAESKILEFNNPVQGVIRIGASDTLCSYYLLKYLKNYKNKNPNVRIHIFNMTTVEIKKSLMKGEIDLGFINQPCTLNDNIQVQKIQILQDCFICGSEYVDKFKDVVNLIDLMNYPIILLEEGTSMRNFVNEFFKENGINCMPELELGSIDLLTKFTKDNFGISFVTKNFVMKEIEMGEVFVIDIQEKIPERSIGLIKIKDLVLPKSAQEFYDIFIQSSK